MCGRHTPEPIRCVGSTRGGAHERRAPPRTITELVEVQERTSALRQAQGPGARYSAFDSRRILARVSICFACDV